MAERSLDRGHADIHAKLAELHEAAAEREGHSLLLAKDR